MPKKKISKKPEAYGLRGNPFAEASIVPKVKFRAPLTPLFGQQKPKTARKKAAKITHEALSAAVAEAEAQYRTAIEAHSVVRAASRDLKKKIEKLPYAERSEASKIFDDIESQRRAAAREEIIGSDNSRTRFVAPQSRSTKSVRA